MKKRQKRLTATLRMTLVLFLVSILFFTGAVPTGALEWNGDSSTGSSTGRPVEDNSFWVSSSALSDLSNIIVAWRFTFYDKDGIKPHKDTNNGTGGYGVQYVEIWLPNTSEDFWDSSNYYWISSVVNTTNGNIKYSKLDFAQAAAAGKIAPGPLETVDRSYSAARKGCWLFGSTNWFDQFGGFTSEIPASSSAIGAWCTHPTNANTLALALGCPGGTAGMNPGDIIVVEPVFWQQANGERVAATASEFASMGALYAGLDSDGLVYSVEGTTDGTWGATCKYTNLKYPTYLYTPDGMGLWDNAVLKSGASDWEKLYTMREIMTGGYGVGIAFSIPKAVSYTLTVNPNGGSWNGTTGNSSFTIDSGSTKTIANPTRTGYTFAGWTVSGGGSISGTTYTQGDGDCTLTAQWSVNSYTQVNNFYKYDPYNGTWSYYTSKSTSAAYGSTFYCTTDGIATPTGYYWSHFNRNSWTVMGDKNDGDGNGHFYPIQYTVTYDANGGSGAPAAQDFYMNGIGLSGTAYYSSTVPTRTGYTFSGWYCPETGQTVSAGQAIPNGWGSHTLVAQWTVNNYTLTVNPNGGSWNSTTSNSSFTLAYGSTKTIANPTRTGYTFAGWTVSGSGSISGTTYTQGDGDCSLTAQWTVNTYTNYIYHCKWDPYSSTWALQGTTTFAGTFGSSVTIPTSHIQSYVGFGNTGNAGSNWGTSTWSSKAIGGTFTQPAGGVGYIEYLYYPIQYTVTYDANGGSGAPAAQNFYMNGIGLSGTAYYSSTVPTRTGYTFAGWVCRENGISVSAGEAIPNSWGSHTLVAQWTVNSYTQVNNFYKYDPYNGTWSYYTSKSTSATYGSTFYCTTDGIATPTGYYWSHFNRNSWTVTGDKNDGDGNGHFYPIQYTITYDANGGSGAPAAQNFYMNGIGLSGTAYYSSTVPTRTGYTFAGWVCRENGISVSAGEAIPNSWGSHTLVAQWTVNTYYLDLNGYLDGTVTGSLSGFGTADVYINGTLVADDVEDFYSEYPYGTTYEIKDIKTQTGKQYNGVYSGSLSGTITYTTSVFLDFSTTVYSLTVNPNGGSWNSTTSNSSFTLAYGSTKTIANPTRTGYTFAGWTVSGSGSLSGTTYTQGAGNCTLTAKWTANNYTLTVNPNGGSWDGKTSNSSFTLAYGSTKAIANPTRTGYTFAGWTVSGSGSISGTTYTQGAGNCTLTAKWTVNNYTLTVNPNGGSWDGKTSNSTFTIAYGSTKAIANPTRTGYTFAGWTVSGSGSISGTTYTQGAGNCTLTAKWTANAVNYTVRHWKMNLSGSGYTEDTASRQTLTANADSTVTLANLKKSFTGFTYKEGKVGNTVKTTATVLPDGSLVIDLYYTRNQYTVTVNKGTGISSVTGGGTYYYGASVTVNATVGTGYTWKNWTGSSSSTNQQYTFTMGAANVTLTANATVNSYTLTVNPNGGSWNSTTSSSSFTLAYGSTKAIANPTRTGYTFAGWTVSGSGSLSGTTYTQGAGNCTLTAKWTVNNYTLTVNPNGGSWNSTTSNSSFTLAYGSTKTIANPTRTGYTFAGWTVSGSGSLSGTTYTQGAGNCTLTAKWTPIIYTVTYDANGGSGAPGRQEKYHGIDITLSTSKPTKPGYTFTEWNTRADGSGTGYAPGDSYTANASVTLYAQWEAAIEISIITPNAAYGADTEVITSFLISNNSGQHILPSDGIKVSFTVTKSTGTIATLSKSEVVIPAGETNMVWFKWTVPASVPSSLHLACTVSDAGGNVLDLDERSWHTGKAENYQTPDTVFEAAAPQYWVMPSVPVTNNPSASWWEWVYENGAFEKKEYEAHLETEAFTITPDPDILSNYWNGSVWTMRSGYGILMDWKTRLVSTGSSNADAGMVTAAQTAYALFPEFGYAQADGSCRLLDRLSDSFVFPVNPASDDNDRLHYTPLWFPDGTQIYKVAGTAYDCWTPAGMISIVDTSGGISIDGSIYDDWYIGRFPR